MPIFTTAEITCFVTMIKNLDVNLKIYKEIYGLSIFGGKRKSMQAKEL